MLKNIIEKEKKIESIVATVTFVVMVAMTSINVFSRYLFGKSLRHTGLPLKILRKNARNFWVFDLCLLKRIIDNPVYKGLEYKVLKMMIEGNLW